MTSIPQYTINRLLIQQAVLERDVAQDDRYGGQNPPEWEELATVPCRLYWDKSTGARSANRTYVSVSREVPISEGGMIIPSGTDVTEEDRVVRVLTSTGDLFVDGIFEIVAVINQFTHFELSVQRTGLGA